jgi:uncharacterized protein
MWLHSSSTIAFIVRLLSFVLIALCSNEAAAQAMVSSRQTPELALHRTGPSVTVSIPLNRSSRGDAGLSRRALLEMGAVALTGVGHLAFSEADASAVFIPIARAGWGGYVYHRSREDADFLRTAGFTSENLGPAFRDASILAAGSLALMAGIGAAQGLLTLDRDMVPALLLYPAWGLLQQFLVQGLVAGNLNNAPGWIGSPYFITPVTAAVFGSVHLPNWKLTAGTLALGLAYTPLYLKHGNLWPLGGSTTDGSVRSTISGCWTRIRGR